MTEVHDDQFDSTTHFICMGLAPPIVLGRRLPRSYRFNAANRAALIADARRMRVQIAECLHRPGRA